MEPDRRPTPPTLDPSSRLFGTLAVKRGLVTPQQVQECLEEQQGLSKAGTPLPLGQLLIRKRYITTQQFLAILQLQKKSFVVCRKCNKRYNVAAADPGKRFRCRACGELLTVPRKPDSDVGAAGTLASTDTGLLRSVRGKGPSASGKVFFGSYEILEELARGGMGVIYKARQAAANRIVALKVLKEGEGASLDQIKRFHREAQIAARLRHPNIVPIHDVGVVAEVHYFTMDFVEGKTLADLMRGGQLDSTLALRTMAKVARAVHYAHGQGVLHRDLKPANILLDREFEPHITDFGLAKDLGVKSRLTRTGAALGTPFYMSPEQARGDTKRVDARSDVFALGIILYEALTGKLPFDGESALAVYSRIVQSEPAPPRQLSGEMSQQVETVILKALEKDPRRRYATAQALAEELERLLRGESILARPPGAALRAGRWLREHALISAAAACLVLGLLVAFGIARCSRSAELRQHLEQGRSLLAEGRADGARREFQRALLLEPGNTEAKQGVEQAQKEICRQMVEEAHAKLQEGDVHRARILLGQALELSPRDPAIQRALADVAATEKEAALLETLAEARQAFDRGEYDRARVLYEEVLAQSPGQAEAEQGLARVEQAVEAEVTQRALAEVRRALEKGSYDGAAALLERLPESAHELPQCREYRRRALGLGSLSILAEDGELELTIHRIDRETFEVAPAAEEEGATPLQVELPPGEYQIIAYRNGKELMGFPVIFERQQNGSGSTIDLIVPSSLPPGMVFVPEGTFVFGGGPPGEAEQNPRQVLRLNSYLVDRFEVSNAEYLEYLETLSASQRWWRTPFCPEVWPGGILDPEWRQYPVRGLLYEDALAYARWAGKRLPSEEEWEKAARGPDGRSYVWGNTPRALENIMVMGMPCGERAFDVSPYGCHDLTGNVTEWTVAQCEGEEGGFTGLTRGGTTLDEAYFTADGLRTDFIWESERLTNGFRCARSWLPLRVKEQGDSDSLLSCLQDPDWGRRLEALALLERAALPESPESLLDLLDDEMQEVRVRAASFLASLLNPELAKRLESIVLERATSERMRAAAMRALSVDQLPTVLSLAERVWKTASEKLRLRVTELLRDREGPEAAPFLVGTLSDPSVEVRFQGGIALSWLDSSETASLLKECVEQQKDEKARCWAFYGLAYRGDEEAAQSLRCLVASPAAKLDAALALGCLRDPAALVPLFELYYGTEDPTLERLCWRYVYRYDYEERTADAFLTGLENSNPELRGACATWIGLRASSEAIPVLQKLATEDPEYDVRVAARDAIEMIRAREQEEE